MTLVGVCTLYDLGLSAGFMIVPCSCCVVMFTSVSGFSAVSGIARCLVITKFLLSSTLIFSSS